MTKQPPLDPPPTRWEQTVTGDRWDFYVDRFAREFADGADLEGEARFIDVLAPRHSRILDGGCGTGRVAAALHRMGHRSIGADRDAGLVAIAVERYPGPAFLAADLLALTPERLTAAGGPDDLRCHRAGGQRDGLPGARYRAGRAAYAGRSAGPGWPIGDRFRHGPGLHVSDLDRDAAAVGLIIQHRFATWHLDPWVADADWAVTVLRRGE